MGRKTHQQLTNINHQNYNIMKSVKQKYTKNHTNDTHRLTHHKTGIILILRGKTMQTQDIRVTIRVNRELKENAETLFDYLGLNMTNAVNIFLRKAVDQKGIPFPVNTGVQGIGKLGTEEITALFRESVLQDIDKKQRKGLPVAKYDTNTNQAYLENADGSREYV